MKFTQTRITQGIAFLEGKTSKRPDWLLEHIELKAGKLWSGKLEIVPWETRADVIKTMYDDPRHTGGRDRLYEHLTERYLGISRRAVADFLKNNVTHQVHQPLPKRRVTRPIIVNGPNRVAQIDLVDMQTLKGWNHAQRYILTWVDVFSKYANAMPLTNKTAKAVQGALDTILLTNKVTVIQSDNGGEFGKSTETFLAARGIKVIHSSPYNPRSQGAIERLNKTIKSTIYKMMHVGDTKNWTKMLPDIVENYNNTTHTTTGWKPAELKVAKLSDEEIEEIATRMRGGDPRIQEDAKTFEVGDKVRLALTTSPAERKNTFRKQIKQNWTTTIYEVTNVSAPEKLNVQPQYLVKNLTTGRLSKKKYWSYQMQKVDAEALNGELKEPELKEDNIDAPPPEESKEEKKVERKEPRPTRESKTPATGLEPARDKLKPSELAKKERKPRKPVEKKAPLIAIVKKIHKKQKIGSNNAYLVEWTHTPDKKDWTWEPTRGISHTPQYKEFIKNNV